MERLIKDVFFGRLWIRQRIESFTVEDSSTYSKRVSITVNRPALHKIIQKFRISALAGYGFRNADSLASSGKYRNAYIPIDINTDFGLIDFNVTDEENRSLSVLNDRESREICANLFLDYIVSEKKELAKFVRQNYENFKEILLDLRPTYDIFELFFDDDESFKVILDSINSIAYIKQAYQMLINSSVLIARIDPSNLPKLIKFTHRLSDRYDGKRIVQSVGLNDFIYTIRLPKYFCLKPSLIKISVSQSMRVAGYSHKHIEPSDSDDEVIEVTNTYDSRSHNVVFSPKFEELNTVGILTYSDEFNFRIRPRSIAVVLSSLLVMTLMLSLQVISLLVTQNPLDWSVEIVGSETAAALAVMTIIPSILAVFLTIPLEHPLASIFYSGQRFIMGISCIVMLIVVFMYSVGISGVLLNGGIWFSCAVSLATFLILLGSTARLLWSDKLSSTWKWLTSLRVISIDHV